MAKCKRCGKEFAPKTYNQIYCCGDCYYDESIERNAIKLRINRVAQKYGFEVRNKERIVNAKMLVFRNQHDKKFCPCKADDPEKYCGSQKCIQEVLSTGKCCCNLFHLKNK